MSDVGGISFLFAIVIYVGGFTFVTGGHELGRYGMARLLGVKTRAFSFGFGPEMIGYGKEPSIRWSLKWFPAGFFTRLLNDKSTASYSQQSPWRRAAIIAGGPLGLFLISYFLIWCSVQMTGQLRIIPVVGQILPGLPAETGGLKQDDRVLSINGNLINDFRDIIEAVRISEGRPLNLKVQRDKSELDITITPVFRNYYGQISGYEIGVRPSTANRELLNVGPVAALGIACNRMIKSGQGVFQSIYYNFMGLQRPTVFIGTVWVSGKKYFASMLYVMAIIATMWGGIMVLLFPLIMAWDVYAVRRKRSIVQ